MHGEAQGGSGAAATAIFIVGIIMIISPYSSDIPKHLTFSSHGNIIFCLISGGFSRGGFSLSHNCIMSNGYILLPLSPAQSSGIQYLEVILETFGLLVLLDKRSHFHTGDLETLVEK